MTQEEKIVHYRDNAKEVVIGLFQVDRKEKKIAREGNQKMECEILRRKNNRRYFLSLLRKANSISEIDNVLREARYTI